MKSLLRFLEQTRAQWIQTANCLEEQKATLVGDAVRASAFLAYCGPLSSEGRAQFQAEVCRDLSSRGIPFSGDLDLPSFLVSQASVQAWKQDPLLSDATTLESLTILHCSKTCPLIIDPEGLAFRWLKASPDKCEYFTEINEAHLSKKIRRGGPALVEWTQNHAQLDLLKPLIKQQFIIRDGYKFINFGGKEVQVHPAFKLYLITSSREVPIKLVGSVNPIKFSVSEQALKLELFRRIAKREAPSLIDKELRTSAELTSRLQTKEALETQILEGLGNSITKLITDDAYLESLITQSQQLESLLSKAKNAEASLHQAKIELDHAAAFEAEAEKASVIYSSLTNGTGVDMDQPVSMERFLSFIEATPSLKSENWFALYKKFTMGFSEQDQMTLKIIWAIDLLVSSGQIKREDVALLDLGAEPSEEGTESPFPWIKNWSNLKTLSEWEFTSANRAIFSDLYEIVQKNPEPWKHWIEEEAEPERAAVHIHEGIIREQGPAMAAFLRLCLIHAVRPDRLDAALSSFIEASLGEEFIQYHYDKINEAFLSSSPNEPILLFPEGDPTSAFEDTLAALENRHIVEIAMISEEFKDLAFQRIKEFALSGKWVLLSNYSFLGELISCIPTNAHLDFRIWILAPPGESLPMNLVDHVLKVNLGKETLWTQELDTDGT